MELNLHNFENDEFSDSKYVLTSPRSLKACDSLKIKPAELLYKPLSEFQDELLPTGIPLRDIYEKYDLHERHRQEKLKSCRKCRDQMIREDMHQLMSTNSAFTRDLPVPTRDLPALYDDGYRSSSPLEELTPDVKDKTTLQRLRTAKLIAADTTDVASGDTSGKQFSARDVTGTQSSLIKGTRATVAAETQPSPIAAFQYSPKERHSMRPKSAPSRSISFSQSCDDMRIASRKTARRNRSAEPGYRSRSAWSSRDEVDLSKDFSKSLHVDDLVSWRAPEFQETYLKSKNLRKSLGYSNRFGKVTPRDERILEALYNKNQQEVDEEVNRSLAQIRWEEEKLQYQLEKDISENYRRQLLAERIALAEEQRSILKEKQYRDQEKLRRRLRQHYEENERRWETSANKQHYLQELSHREKRRRSIERKKHQEYSYAQLERSRQEHLSKHLSNSEYQLQKATMNKNNREIMQTMRRKRENLQKERTHRARYGQVTRKSEEFKEGLKDTIEKKDAKARLNQTIVTSARDYALHTNAKERHSKYIRSKNNLRRMEEDMANWKSTLDARRSMLESKAKLTAAQAVELKSLRAQAEREEKEYKHRHTYRRIQDEAELYRQEQKEAIAYKDTKMKLVQHHKDEVVKKVRNLAANSQKMREDLRSRYGKDSFDKKVLETELQNKIGSGYRSGAKNKSTVLIA